MFLWSGSDFRVPILTLGYKARARPDVEVLPPKCLSSRDLRNPAELFSTRGRLLMELAVALHSLTKTRAVLQMEDLALRHHKPSRQWLSEDLRPLHLRRTGRTRF